MNEHAGRAPLLDQLPVLADAVRGRLLLVLEQHPLAVGELCDIVQLPQSTVSRHLKVLADAGWLAVRRDGTSRLYQLDADALEGPSRRLWLLVREQLTDSAAATQDERRLKGVLARRRTASEEFFSSAADQWDHVRVELFGASSHLQVVAGLLDPRWAVGDLGCGTGQLAEALAPFVARVVAVDASREMLQAARGRLGDFANVELRRGTLERLPIDDASLDVAMVTLVLHHVAAPDAVFAEARRVLKPGGRLVVADMLPHDRDEYRQTMGHVWLGFSERQISRYFVAAGFDGVQVHPLPAQPGSKGPALFVAAGRARGVAEPGDLDPTSSLAATGIVRA